MTTDELLALKYPLFRKDWLDRIHAKLAQIVRENGGNVEMHVRWRQGKDLYTDWIQRDLSTNDTQQNVTER